MDICPLKDKAIKCSVALATRKMLTLPRFQIYRTANIPFTIHDVRNLIYATICHQEILDLWLSAHEVLFAGLIIITPSRPAI